MSFFYIVRIIYRGQVRHTLKVIKRNHLYNIKPSPGGHTFLSLPQKSMQKNASQRKISSLLSSFFLDYSPCFFLVLPTHHQRIVSFNLFYHGVGPQTRLRWQCFLVIFSEKIMLNLYCGEIFFKSFLFVFCWTSFCTLFIDFSCF